MTDRHTLAVSVNAEWNDWRFANARLSDLQDVHWHQPTGAPQPLVHAYVSCADFVVGTLPHACEPSSAPHRIRVCVLKSHNIPDAHAELARQADGRRGARLPMSAEGTR
jgi:hypothetical protein